MNFFKQHWFGFLITLILGISFLFFVLILLSPRQDAQKRGFIPCTEAMADGILACPQDGYYTCLLKHILQNSWCDTKVIGKGIKSWLTGKQKTPWANYIYTPELPVPENEDSQELRDFYAENPDLRLDMLKLHMLSNELDKKIAEEENKNVKK